MQIFDIDGGICISAKSDQSSEVLIHGKKTFYKVHQFLWDPQEIIAKKEEEN